MDPTNIGLRTAVRTWANGKMGSLRARARWSGPMVVFIRVLGEIMYRKVGASIFTRMGRCMKAALWTIKCMAWVNINGQMARGTKAGGSMATSTAGASSQILMASKSMAYGSTAKESNGYLTPSHVKNNLQQKAAQYSLKREYEKDRTKINW